MRAGGEAAAAAAVGRVSGEADVLDARTGARLGRVAAAPGGRAAQGGVRVAGLAFLGGAAQGEPAQRLLACTARGAASVHAAERPAGEAEPAGDGGSNAVAVGCEWATQTSWAVGNEVLCMVRAPGAVIAGLNRRPSARALAKLKRDTRQASSLSLSVCCIEGAPFAHLA